jgi:hypothetical protein
VQALALGVLLLAADAAVAARVVDVRVGMHPGYARVVLETDAPAAHEIVTAPAVTPGEVVVRIAATSAARALPGRGATAPEVVLEPQPDGTTLARIRAAGPVRVETQVLRAPPRLVLDLRAGTPAAEPAAAPAGETAVEIAAAAPEPAPAAPEPEAVTEVEPIAPVAPPPPVEASSIAAPPEQSASRPEAVPIAVAPEPEAAPVVIPEPPALAETPTPPVAAPPPAAIAFEPRSLAVGAALGVGIALLGLAARRARRPEPALEAVVAAAASPADEIAAGDAPAAPDELAPPLPLPPPLREGDGEPDASAEADIERAEDVSRMHRRLDARLAEVAARLDAVAARQAELDRHEGAQTQEIAAQRAAIARLQRALRVPPRPRKSGKDAG